MSFLIRSLSDWKAPVEQNVPTLFGENESTASGALPAWIAAVSFSSLMLPTPCTVIHGYLVWKPLKAAW